MKRVLLSLFALVTLGMGVNAQYVRVYKDGSLVKEYAETEADEFVYTDKPLTSGTTDGRTWVQLWKDGPKFAEMNVGTAAETYENVTDYTKVGGYYTWGGSVDKDVNGEINYNKGTTQLTGDDDTATKLWGSNWRMPTSSELQGLIDNCTWTWMDGSATQYAEGCTLAGWKVTGKGDYSGNSIFLPAAGRCNGGIVGSGSQGSIGNYWSSAPDKSYPNESYSLIFNSDVQYVLNGYCYVGRSVRAVVVE